MSQENLDALRRIYAAWSGGDFRAGAEIFDPKVEFILSDDYPDPATYSGPSGVWEYMGPFLRNWDEFRIEAREFIENEDRILVAGHQTGRGLGSGVSVDQLSYAVWTFRADLAQRVVWFLDREKALDAAGLRQ